MSRAQVSLAFSLGLLAEGLMAYPVGRWIDRGHGSGVVCARLGAGDAMFPAGGAAAGCDVVAPGRVQPRLGAVPGLNELGVGALMLARRLSLRQARPVSSGLSA
ncbi:MAG: hypothetical protein WBI05_01250 [Rhodoferax sp.]|uniref:hypothetical protein n=1 Tax=Rhodoferax sp. TaxID=50421 RepID=UPI003C772432